MDAESGGEHRITTSTFAGQDAIRVKSIRDIVTLYRRKREAKSLGPDGTVCSRDTVGLLQRRPVRDLTVRHIGKEANEIEEIAAGLLSPDQATTTYTQPSRDAYSRLVLPAVRAFREAMVAQGARLPRRTINGLRGGRRPDRRTLAQLIPALVRLCARGGPELDGGDDLGVLAAWRDRHVTLRVCPACGDTPPVGRVYCRAACRHAAYRRRRE